MKIHSKLSILGINLALRIMSVNWRGVQIGIGSWIKSRTSVGAGSGIGWGLCVRGEGELRIGKYCAIGEDVRIITSNHDTSRLAINYNLQHKLLHRHFASSKQDVVIGNDVWIGDRAIILAGVTIGDGAVIGAGAVVTKSVAAYAIAAGNPARVTRHRFDEATVAKIEQLGWWNWSFDRMRKNKALFSADAKDLVERD